MNKNFRVRLICGLCLFAITMIALYTFHAVPFRILVWVVAAIAALELFSFLKKRHSRKNIVLVIIQLVFLIYGAIFLMGVTITEVWYIIFGVCGYDIFAYLFGKAFGGKIIKHHRPFPKISKNKTWEGTFFGLAISTLMVGLALYFTGSTSFAYLLCGPLALVGDLYESYLKRQFKVKDSNEIVIKNKYFAKLELVVGGSEGHGGFLDRIDSIAFTTTMLLIILAFGN